MLRNVLGCTLPIELYHFPDELEDPAVRQQLENDFAVDLKEVGAISPSHADGSSAGSDQMARTGISRTPLSFSPSLQSSSTWTV